MYAVCANPRVKGAAQLLIITRLMAIADSTAGG
jgi:hypothetical protein